MTYDQIVGKPKGIKKLLYKLFPRYVWLPIPFELYALWVRIKSRRLKKLYKHQRNLLVNIGAGPAAKQGWANLDLYPGENINCVYDCRGDLPFADNSVKCIFSEHFLEHLEYFDQVPRFLSECHRVLMNQGVIRIIVPDAEKYLRAYCEEGWGEMIKIRQLGLDHNDVVFNWKYNTKMELINFVFRQGMQHRFAYDYSTLEHLLYKHGFTFVKKQEFGKSMIHELSIDLLERARESLYVEAIK